VSWPDVHDEFKTLAKLHEGFSIARFGDGELKMMDGASYIREDANKAMARELRHVLRHPHKMCLPAIWPLNPKSPKIRSLSKHKTRYLRFLSPKVEYYSSLITRPDSAPWIRTKEFAESFAKLWRGKRIFVVCEKESGALRALKGEDYAHFVCKRHGAYSQIDAMESDAVGLEPDIAILACGPTATCLANRLAKRGIQTIDFGSAGAFIAKLLHG
jgi:hypothetical protein